MEIARDQGTQQGKAEFRAAQHVRTHRVRPASASEMDALADGAPPSSAHKLEMSVQRREVEPRLRLMEFRCQQGISTKHRYETRVRDGQT